MDRNRIMELALEQLQQKRAVIDAELEMIRAELKDTGAAVLRIKSHLATDIGKRRSRTPTERTAHAKRMREYWAAKKGKKTKMSTAPKVSHAANAKRKIKTDAEKKALSRKLKEAWKKRKAAAAKSV